MGPARAFVVTSLLCGSFASRALASPDAQAVEVIDGGSSPEAGGAPAPLEPAVVTPLGGVAAPAVADEPTAPLPAANAAPGEPEPIDEFSSLSLESLLNLQVVTASGGVAEERDVSSANVFVYTRGDIANYGWQSLADLLAYVPGLYVIDDLVSPAVMIRGTSGGFKSATRIVKVMINGIEVNFRPDMTAFIGPEYIPLDAVDRVEIAKGPLSALYGSNAFLATVNVITRKPQAGTHASLGATGHFGSARGAGGWSTISYGGPRASLLVSILRHEVDRSGLTVQTTFPTQDPTRTPYRAFFSSESKNDISSPQAAYLNLNVSGPSTSSIDLQAGLQQLDANGEFQSSSAMTHESRYAVRNLWSDLHIRTHAPLAPWIRLGWSQGAPRRDDLQLLSENNRYAFRRNFNYRAGSARAGLSYQHRWLSVAADGEYTRELHRVLYFTQIFRAAEGTRLPGEEVDVLPSPDENTQRTIQNFAGHVQLVVKDLIPNLRFVGDVRGDKSNLYPAELSWRGAVAYRWREGITTRLIAGRAFQAPSAVLLFAIPGFGSSDNIFGNRTVPGQLPLVPQTVQSAELVQTVRINHYFEVVPALFAQQLDKSIEFTTNGIGYIARNSEARRSFGGEVTGQLILGRWQSQLGVSWLRPLASASGTSKLDRLPALPFFPDYWLTAGLSVAVPEAYVRLTAIARAVSQRGPSEQNLLLNNSRPYTLPGYFSTDLAVSTLGLKLLGEQDTTARLVVRDISNTGHNEPGPVGVDLPVLGRAIVLDVSQTF